LAAFAGLGNIPGWLLFPYYIISLCFTPVNSTLSAHPWTWLTYAQSLVYGVLLGQAWARGVLGKTTAWVVAVHVIAIAVALLVWPYTGLGGPL
jgi:hypothetical protein